MSLKYRLVTLKNIGRDAAAVPEKIYAQAVNNGHVSFDEICEDISEECTLTSADVKAVLDRMNVRLRKHLRAGRIVQLGELGNFRMSFGSSGVAEEQTFEASRIRRPKIIFTPGKVLRNARKDNSFEKEINREQATSPAQPPSSGTSPGTAPGWD